MKESFNSEEKEDINFVLRDLQYSSILDIPFHVRVLHQLFSFFGKINTSIAAPTFLGYIYYIILIIQSFLPSFLIDCEDIWPKKSFISMLLYILCYLYQGPHALYKSYRVVVSIIISAIFVILFIILIVRARHYQKAGRVSSSETKFFYFTFKYIMPLFCPHIISGVTISFDQIVNQNRIDYNIFCIILSIITIVSYLYLNYAIICPRVLFEDTPSHEWVPLLTAASILNTILLSCISGIAGCVDGRKRVGCSICMLLISAAMGALFFLTNGIIKMMINVVSTATYFASAFASLFITIVLLISKTIAPEIIFIISVVALIALIIVMKILKQMKTTKMMMFFDSLIDSDKLSDQILSEKYNSSFIFLCDLRSSIEMWHPIISNFEIFEFAVSKWPDKFDVLLFYSRILTIFPSQNHKMISIASKISDLPESNVRTSYLYQFRHFSRSRQTSVTPVFQEKFEEIITQTETTTTVIKRFWEDILQNNVSNFWSESDNVISTVSELDSLYAQLIDDYNSNLQLLKSYSEFVQNIKHDTDESREVFKKLENLRMNGVNDSDLALKIALRVFPNLNNCIELYENINNNNNSIEFETNNNKDNNNDLLDESKQNTSENEDNLNTKENDQKQNNDSDLQFELLFSDLTKHSKLGSIWIVSIIIIVMGIVSIVLFYLFYKCYIDKFVKKQENAIKFIIQINMLLNELCHFSANINLLPLIYTNETDIPIALSNSSGFTEKVAPVLYDNGQIDNFSLDAEGMLDMLSTVKHKFTQTINFLSKLDKKDEMVQELNDLFYVEKNESFTFNELFNNLLLTAQDLIKIDTIEEYFIKNNLYSNYLTSFYSIFEKLNSLASVSHDYCSNGYSSSQQSLNEKMILAVLLTLLLLTLPYLIQMLIIYDQSEAIATSFTIFPKTEIRSIINQYGESSKIEDNEQSTIISNIKSNNKFDALAFILTFVASFIAIIVCSLVIYFTSIDFLDSAEPISNEIYTSIQPFSYLYYEFVKIFRFYMIAHDCPTSVYNYDSLMDLTKNKFYMGNPENLSEMLRDIDETVNLTKSKIAEGIYGIDSRIGVFYHNHESLFNYFKDDFPVDTDDIAMQKTFFETLITCVFTEAISHVSDFLAAYYFEANFIYDYALQYSYAFSELRKEIKDMPSVIYWFSKFADENRIKIYIKLIEDDVLDRISIYVKIGEICLYLVIAWQIVACLCMFLYLLYKHKKIKRALYFYKFFRPEVILQNQTALALIDSGKQFKEDNNADLFSSDSIFSKITQGCIIVNTDFKIINFNDSFIKLFEMNDNNIIGRNLFDVVPEDGQDKTFERVIWGAKNAMIGKYKTSFSENISVKLQNGKTAHFNCTLLCMTPLGIANENEIAKIDKIAFIFDENTEVFMRKLQIEKENEHLNQMLSNTMPSRIVKSFMGSNECISFIVQSVSIGSIRVKVQKHFDENTTDEFIFYNQIFKRFDDEIKEFDLLSKLNTFSHTYTFIGGLFSEINKPERHAEESIKFALNLLKIIPEMSEKFGAEIQLTIGVHTGGPIVAGVINFEKPTFQIIGTVSEMANQMKNKGFPQTICISRAVYELIFSAGFKVQEQGDTTIKGGKVIPTYLVRL